MWALGRGLSSMTTAAPAKSRPASARELRRRRSALREHRRERSTPRGARSRNIPTGTSDVRRAPRASSARRAAIASTGDVEPNLRSGFAMRSPRRSGGTRRVSTGSRRRSALRDETVRVSVAAAAAVANSTIALSRSGHEEVALEPTRLIEARRGPAGLGADLASIPLTCTRRCHSSTAALHGAALRLVASVCEKAVHTYSRRAELSPRRRAGRPRRDLVASLSHVAGEALERRRMIATAPAGLKRWPRRRASSHRSRAQSSTRMRQNILPNDERRELLGYWRSRSVSSGSFETRPRFR